MTFQSTRTPAGEQPRAARHRSRRLYGAAGATVTALVIAPMGVSSAAFAGSTTSALAAASQPAAPTVAAQTPKATGPVTVPFSFPPGLLMGKHEFAPTYTRVDGVLSVPTKPGKHPVAIIVHGSYPNCVWKDKDTIVDRVYNSFEWQQFCGKKRGASKDPASGATLTDGYDYIRWQASWAHLAQSLAGRGIAALAIDGAAMDAMQFSEPSPDKIARKLHDVHLRILAEVNKGNFNGMKLPASVKGSLDLSNLALIGHSSAGARALHLAQEKTMWPGVKTLVGIQPVVQYDNTPFTHKLPTLVVASPCDEQARYDEIQPQMAAAGKRNGTAPYLFASLEKSYHLGLIGGGDWSAGLGRPPGTKECKKNLMAKPALSRSALSVIVTDFVAQVFAKSPYYSFGVSSAVPVKPMPQNKSTKVITRPVKTLPADVPAQSVKFVNLSKEWLPAMPKSAQGGTTHLP